MKLLKRMKKFHPNNMNESYTYFSYKIIFRENFLRVMIILGVLENQPKNVTHLKLKHNCLFLTR